MATLVLQKRNYAKSMRTYMMLTLLTLLLAGYYGYTQYVKLSGAQDALDKEQTQITALLKTETQANKDFGNLQKDFDANHKEFLDALQKVYPSDENYTTLARELDDFFHSNNDVDNPLFANDIKFGQPRFDAKLDYGILPVSMTVVGTQENFIKFLKYVENSGVLADGTRLMDIRSISINFSSTDENSAQPMINVSVALNAYFQKPLSRATDAKDIKAPTPTAS